jgi:NAD(P)H-hydrate epimerase
MTEPLPETPGQAFSSEALPAALSLAEGMTAVAIGPGLGTAPETVSFLRQFIQKCPVPMVIDADGLNALEGAAGLLKKCGPPVIVTPHPGEMARLVSSTAARISRDRVEAAAKFASSRQVHVILKGYRSVIASPSGQILINSTGNPGMGSGGTGDLLTGMVGGLLSQGRTPLEAAAGAVYLHGLAGDLAAEEKGEYALIAGDIMDAIPAAMKASLLFGDDDGQA